MNDTNDAGSTSPLGRDGVGRCAVACPMCGHVQTQYRLNPRMYWYNDLDLDRKPSGFQCLKGLAGLYPPLYDLWHCPKCHFTTHNRTFPDPLKNVFIEKGLVQRHLAEAAKPETAFSRVCEVLGADQNIDKVDFESAIRCALLAVYFDTFIVGLLRQGYAALARSCLRLAWLHRDWASMDADYDSKSTALRAKLEKLAVYWSDIPRSENDALRLACVHYEAALNEASVENDPMETATILMHLARICLQMGDTSSPAKHLEACRRGAMEEQNRLAAVMHEDDRRRELPEDERGQLVSASRRIKTMIDDCGDLHAEIRRLQATTKTTGTSSQVKSPETKKGLLKGFFGG